MTKREVRPEPIGIKALLAEDSDRLGALVQAIVQATLEAEMTAALGRRSGSGARSSWVTGPAITAVR